MKIINKFFIMILIALSGCQVSTLTDETANKFVATASQGTLKDSIEVEWVKTDYYANFTVLRSTSEKGTYVPITHRIKESKYVDNYNIIEGTTYYYKVQGYNDIGKVMYTAEPAEGYAGSGGGFLPPKDITINTGASTKKLVLSWERIENAYSYEILRSEDNVDFVSIATVSFLHYEDKNVELGKTYYYQITSLDKDGFPSPNRSQVIQGSLFGTDLGLGTAAGAYDDKIVLTWEKYEHATRYLLYRSESSGITGDLIKTIEQSGTMEYSDTDVETGKLYYYTIMYQNERAVNQSDTVRGYLKTDKAPGKPTGFTASQGVDPKNVELNWTAVEGAISYEIARSVSKTGPWEIITTTTEDGGVTSYKDIVPDDSYIYFYTVTGLNPAPGTVSDIKEGWANKAPINITASDSFGEKVVLTWDSVTNARSYAVSSSETLTGTYRPVGSASLVSSSGRISFDHIYDIGSNLSKELFYKVQVTTSSGSSLPSAPVLGVIKKIGSPQNVVVIGNKTATKSMKISWNDVPGAKSYNIYRATLSHKNSNPNKLKVEHFKKVGSSQNRAYDLSFNTYPIRRYVYMVKAVDGGGAEGVLTKTDLVWRMPADLVDFARDIDFSIVQAQTQISGFGGQGSGGNVKGRAGGQYQYYAGLSGSKNNWLNYSSFEIILHGNNPVSVDIWSMSASLSGTTIISGLYSGKVTYNNLAAKDGGYVTGGGMTFEYNHPTKGWLKEYWDAKKAGGLLNSVVLFGSEDPPWKPSYEEGNG